MSSLFRQIFSESDVNTAYHNMIRGPISPYKPPLSRVLIVFRHEYQGYMACPLDYT